MALTIKNPESCRLVRELANLTGETITQAVTVAVRARLDRLISRRQAGLADRLLRIGKDCAGHLNEPSRSADHGNLLYEEGLPGGLGTEISRRFAEVGLRSDIPELRGNLIKPPKFE
jgi:antitoxin VapB